MSRRQGFGGSGAPVPRSPPRVMPAAGGTRGGWQGARTRAIRSRTHSPSRVGIFTNLAHGRREGRHVIARQRPFGERAPSAATPSRRSRDAMRPCRQERQALGHPRQAMVSSEAGATARARAGSFSDAARRRGGGDRGAGSSAGGTDDMPRTALQLVHVRFDVRGEQHQVAAWLRRRGAAPPRGASAHPPAPSPPTLTSTAATFTRPTLRACVLLGQVYSAVPALGRHPVQRHLNSMRERAGASV